MRWTPPNEPVDTIESLVYYVEKSNKYDLLVYLLETMLMDKVLIFKRTKHSCNKLVKKLDQDGFYAMAIHSNKSQNKREDTLEQFREGKIDILVGTDVVARGA